MSTYASLAISNEYVKMRWSEPYTSAGLNKKEFGITRAGIYAGFVIGVNGVNPRGIDIGPGFVSGGVGTGSVSGYAQGGYDASFGYSVAVKEVDGYDLTIQIPPGVSAVSTIDTSAIAAGRKFIVVDAAYSINQTTTANFLLVDGADIDINPTYIVVGYVDIPDPSVPLDGSMLGYFDETYPRLTPLSTPRKAGLMPASAWDLIGASGQFAYDGMLEMGVSDISGFYVTISPSQKIFNGKRVYSFVSPSFASKFPRNRFGKYNGGVNNDQPTYLNISTGSISGAHRIHGNSSFAKPSVIGNANSYQAGLVTLDQFDNLYVVYGSIQTTYAATQDEDNMPQVSTSMMQIGAFIASTDGSGSLLPLDPLTDIIWRLPYLNTGSGGLLGSSVQWFPESLLGVNGVQTIFTLSQMPQSNDSVLIFQNGYPLNKNLYSISGKTITFITAPGIAVNLSAWYVISSVSDFTCNQEQLLGVDGVQLNFPLSKVPEDIQAMWVWNGPLLVPNNGYKLVYSTTGVTLQFINGFQPTIAQELYVFYVTENANAFVSTQEVPGGIINGTNLQFTLSQVAQDRQSILVFRDKLKVDDTEWFLVSTSTQSYIQFVFGDAPTVGQDIYVSYFVQIKPVALNVVSQVGGAGYTVKGSSTSPITFSQNISLGVTSDPQILQYIASSGGAYQVNANPQIAPGFVDGQVLSLKGTSDVNYVILTDGNGLSLNGNCNMVNGQVLMLFWDAQGGVWQELSRRI